MSTKLARIMDISTWDICNHNHQLKVNMAMHILLCYKPTTAYSLQNLCCCLCSVMLKLNIFLETLRCSSHIVTLERDVSCVRNNTLSCCRQQNTRSSERVTYWMQVELSTKAGQPLPGVVVPRSHGVCPAANPLCLPFVSSHGELHNEARDTMHVVPHVQLDNEAHTAS